MCALWTPPEVGTTSVLKTVSLLTSFVSGPPSLRRGNGRLGRTERAGTLVDTSGPDVLFSGQDSGKKEIGLGWVGGLTSDLISEAKPLERRLCGWGSFKRLLDGHNRITKLLLCVSFVNDVGTLENLGPPPPTGVGVCAGTTGSGVGPGDWRRGEGRVTSVVRVDTGGREVCRVGSFYSSAG